MLFAFFFLCDGICCQRLTGYKDCIKKFPALLHEEFSMRFSPLSNDRDQTHSGDEANGTSANRRNRLIQATKALTPSLQNPNYCSSFIAAKQSLQ